MPYPKRTFPPLSRLYHATSRLTSARPFYISPVAEEAMAGAYSSFPGRPVIEAPQNVAREAELDRLLDARSSTRAFAGHIGKQSVFDVLTRATRINRASTREDLITAHRVYPSPGGLYPVELYLIPMNVEGLPFGAYHWDVLDERLEELWPLPPFSMTAAVPGIQPSTDVPAAIVGLSVYFPRIEWKYGDRSYRFALMEAAAIASNLHLVCTDLGISCRWVGGFQDEWWDDALRLDGDQETTLLTFAFG